MASAKDQRRRKKVNSMQQEESQRRIGKQQDCARKRLKS